MDDRVEVGGAGMGLRTMKEMKGGLGEVYKEALRSPVVEEKKKK